jgi:8-oxo-dGTP pyrophosphatase MutT (NUDIX family)
MPQVYAMIYDQRGNVIVFRKNTTGYFFNKKPIQRGKPLNGAGQYCFPGGRMDGSDGIVDGALRELFEETTIGGANLVATPDPYSDEGIHYYGVYLRVPNGNIHVLSARINACLRTAERVKEQIRTSTFDGEWPDNCPHDNELASCEVVHINQLMRGGRFVDKNPSTGWFYKIVVDIRDNLP